MIPEVAFRSFFSLPDHTAMSPLVTDLNENLSAHRANHSEQNGPKLREPAVV